MTLFRNSKGKIFQRHDVGPWNGFTEPEIKKAEIDAHYFNGLKIPTLDIWPQVIAFFEWSYAQHQSESVVHLYYHANNPSRGWLPLVLPQKSNGGMTARVLEDHPNYIPTQARLRETLLLSPDDMYIECTVHHHCRGSAFASGTDKSDEQQKDGLHITIGGIATGKYDIHARTVFRKKELGVCYTDWFEIDEFAAAHLPVEVHEVYIKGLLTKQYPGATFPEWWKENYVKPEIQVYSSGIGFQSGYCGSGNWQRRDDGSWGYGPINSQPLVVKDFATELRELIDRRRLEHGDLEWLYEVMDDANAHVLGDIYDLLDKHKRQPWTVTQVLDSMVVPLEEEAVKPETKRDDYDDEIARAYGID